MCRSSAFEAPRHLILLVRYESVVELDRMDNMFQFLWNWNTNQRKTCEGDNCVGSRTEERTCVDQSNCAAIMTESGGEETVPLGIHRY